MSSVILTCSPYFLPSALNELQRHRPQIKLLHSIAPTCHQLDSPYPFEQLAAPWKTRTPIYLHHLFPLQQCLGLTGTLTDLAHIKSAAKRLVNLTQCAVQVRLLTQRQLPYHANALQEHLSKTPSSPLTPPSGGVLSVVVSETESGLTAYLGVSSAAQNLSPWVGGQLPITEAVPNRAGYKLLEALATFQIRLRPNDHALDLGASPGAWTTLLRRRGLMVSAVGPDPLYPWLALDEGVRHYPVLAQDYLATCSTPFDLIVNDMMMVPQNSARLMVEFAKVLRPQGIAIMTLKLRDHNTQRMMDHSFRLLRPAYKILQVRQLVSNKHEVTLFLRRHA